MKPPNRAPAMPSRIVTMKPPGSRPGINSLAITPTTRPNRIHDRIPIRFLLLQTVIASAKPTRMAEVPFPFEEAVSRRGLHLEEYSFVLEQPPFSLEAAAISNECARGSDDAVTGDHDGNRIGAVGGADGTHGRGCTDRGGDVQ